MTPAFRTKDGRLTRYAFQCGYVEFDGPFRLWLDCGVYRIGGRGADGIYVSYAGRSLKHARQELLWTANCHGRPGQEKGVVAGTVLV